MGVGVPSQHFLFFRFYHSIMICFSFVIFLPGFQKNKNESWIMYYEEM